MIDKERLSKIIVHHFWPKMQFTEEGSRDDRVGIDGYLNGQAVQIKYDGKIVQTGNIYDEIWEKTKGNIRQKWRRSPSIGVWRIHVTGNSLRYEAYKILSDSLAEAEEGRILTKINPTSKGFLIPIKDVKTIEKRIYLRKD